MNLNQIFDKILFSFGVYNITIGNIILALLILIVLVSLYRFVTHRILPKYFSREDVDLNEKRRLKSIIRYGFLLLILLGLVLGLGVDPELYTVFDEENNPKMVFKISTLLQAFLAIQLARLLDWIISKGVIHNYYKRRGEEEQELQESEIKGKAVINRTVQYIVYVIALLLILRSFQINPTIFPIGGEDTEGGFKLSKIISGILILFCAQLLSWILINLVLDRYYRRKRMNIGSQYAVNQLLKYFLYVIAALIALHNMGAHLTVLWGGAAALLVGVGLGLQQTFNDLISGIILLFERTVEVGHIVEVNGVIGTVKQIGLRTSLVETREEITVVVPNSKLIVDNVVNWSHFDNKVRFKVMVGVAYGSDTKKVKEILLNIARENGFLLKHPSPFVRFKDFGASSLDFELHFWAQDLLRIEDIKSDLRFEIDQAFRENKVEIPFPQRDVWFKNSLKKD